MSVDLPEPEGPIITSFSPRLTVRLISLSTCRSPKYLLRCLISIMSAMNVPSLRLHELNYCTERTTFPQPTLHSRKEPAIFHPLIRHSLGTDLNEYPTSGHSFKSVPNECPSAAIKKGARPRGRRPSLSAMCRSALRQAWHRRSLLLPAYRSCRQWPCRVLP